MSRLETVTGSMFGGKSEETIRRLVRASFAEQAILVLRPKIDSRTTRTIFDLIKKNEHLNYYPRIFTDRFETEENLNYLLKTKHPNARIIAIDEVQFVGNWIVKAVDQLLLQHADDDYRIIISGLDMNFEREPFGPMPQLMAMADEVVKLTAICKKCKHNPANLTYKTGGSQKAKIEVGDSDIYQARCRSCHKLPE